MIETQIDQSNALLANYISIFIEKRMKMKQESEND